VLIQRILITHTVWLSFPTPNCTLRLSLHAFTDASVIQNRIGIRRLARAGMRIIIKLRTAVLTRPPQHIQMTSLCCTGAGARIPIAAVLTRPPKHIQMISLWSGGRRARVRARGKRVEGRVCSVTVAAAGLKEAWPRGPEGNRRPEPPPRRSSAGSWCENCHVLVSQ
jgi:hypothetical protein